MMFPYSENANLRTLVYFFIFLLLFSYETVAEKTPLDIIDDGWAHISTENFQIITDLKPEHALRFSEQLEHFRYLFLRFSEVKMKENIPPLKVFAFRKPSTYKLFKFPRDSGGIFLHRPEGNFAIANMSGYQPNSKKLNFARYVMQHEYVHFAFDISYSDAAIPLWYNEGMAEYFSTLRVVDGHLHYGEVNSDRLTEVDYRKGVDIESLLKADRIPESRKQRINFYAQAMALVHFCYFQPDMREKLVKYLQMVRQNHSVDASFAKAFGVKYDAFGAQIWRYLKKANFQYKRIRQEEHFRFGEIKQKFLSTNASAFHFGELMMAMGLEEKEEALRAISLLELSLLNPGLENGLAMLHLFRIHLGRNDLVAAENMVYRMDAEVPDYPGTRTAAGDLLAEKMRALIGTNDPEWRSYFELAREEYRKAIQINSNFIPAYIGLASIYSNNIDGEINLTEGIRAFEKLTHTLNFPNYDYQYALLLLRYRRPEQARALLTKVIARTPDEEFARKARRLKNEIVIKVSE